MADFFTRLAERTLGLANTIQPVITPFFAPGTPLLDADLEAEQPIDVQDRSPQQQSYRQITPGAEAEPHAERTASPVYSQQNRRIAPRSETTMPDDENPPPQDRGAARAKDADDEPDLRMPISEQYTENSQLVQPDAAPRPRQAPRRIDPTAQTPRLVEGSATPGAARSTSRPQPAETAAESAPQMLVRLDRAEPAQASIETPLPPMIDRRPAVGNRAIRPEQRSLTPVPARAEPALREQSLARAQQTNRSPEPPAPQIHVSIGRIEVRAVTPPPQPAPEPPAAPSAPRMSLDDYLRSQNGGRR